MSLIIDAIKKAQQLRLRETQGAPFLRRYGRKGNGIDSKERRWRLLSILGSGLLLILLVVLWGDTFLSLVIPHPSQAPVLPLKGARREGAEVAGSLVVLSLKEDAKVRAEKKLRAGILVMDGKEASGSQEKEKQHRKKTESEAQITVERAESSPPLFKPAVDQEKRSTPVKSSDEAVAEKASTAAPPRLEEDASPQPTGLDRPIDKDPPSILEATSHFNQAVAFHQKGNNLKALHAYEKVIELDPLYVEAHNNLGVLYQEMGFYDKALDVFHKAIKINPRYEKILNNLGTLLLLRERYEESKEAFQKALSVNPNNIESHVNLGILFKKQGQVDQAIESYHRALAINPLHGEAHYNMALLYEQLGNIETATDHYQKFIQMAAKTHPELVAQVKRHLNYLIGTKGSEK